MFLTQVSRCSGRTLTSLYLSPQRSFLDHLLQASGGGGGGGDGGGKPTNQLAAGGGSSSTGAKEAVNADVFAGAAGPSGAGFEPAAATTTTTTTAEARARRATFGVVREKRVGCDVM